jgi:uncharacterized damage-inducible protein DinB
MANQAPEPWLRGSIDNVSPLLAPVLYAFRQAREDVAAATNGLTPEQLWTRPHGAASIGYHIRHMGGAAQRLMTYVQGRQLSPEQFAAIKSEQETGASREELLAGLDDRFREAEAVVRGLNPATLAESREVGRQRLPSTVIGLLTHIAEHTARHTGQAVTTAKMVRSPDA